ncbi:hypothetical protein [Shinella sp.]|uniref:hypothetical protein n=1 Tax=Shinella sp. TaxID=1870904 RepID=UPI003F72D2DF
MSDDLKALEAFLYGRQPLLDEFEAICRAVLADDTECVGMLLGNIRYDISAGTIRPTMTKVPAGRRRDPDHPSVWHPDRGQLVELVGRFIEVRSRRWNVDEQRIDPAPEDWRDLLQARWPGQFDCELSVHAGWLDLIVAVHSWTEELGARISWTQIKEKMGGLRLYHSGLRSENSSVEEIVTIAEHRLSEHVCEVCGVPGCLRKSGGWYAARCDEHVRPNR